MSSGHAVLKEVDRFVLHNSVSVRVAVFNRRVGSVCMVLSSVRA